MMTIFLIIAILLSHHRTLTIVTSYPRFFTIVTVLFIERFHCQNLYLKRGVINDNKWQPIRNVVHCKNLYLKRGVTNGNQLETSFLVKRVSQTRCNTWQPTRNSMPCKNLYLKRDVMYDNQSETTFHVKMCI